MHAFIWLHLAIQSSRLNLFVFYSSKFQHLPFISILSKIQHKAVGIKVNFVLSLRHLKQEEENRRLGMYDKSQELPLIYTKINAKHTVFCNMPVLQPQFEECNQKIQTVKY